MTRVKSSPFRVEAVNKFGDLKCKSAQVTFTRWASDVAFFVWHCTMYLHRNLAQLQIGSYLLIQLPAAATIVITCRSRALSDSVAAKLTAIVAFCGGHYPLQGRETASRSCIERLCQEVNCTCFHRAQYIATSA
jgi:hypothetical protein